MRVRRLDPLIFRVIGFVALLLCGHDAAHAAARLALIIGNAHYLSAPTLSNPTNDAEDLSTALRSLGFEVIERSDATRAAMADAVREFSERLEGVDTALFFYAGHGVQVNGENYLVPIDAKINTPSDVRFGTINLNDIMGEMEGKGHAAIVLLDACRDNPFADAVAKSGRSLGGRGLGRIDPNGAGMLVVYSTQPNNIALDGGGRNSPFTSALLASVQKPGLEVRQLVSKVRADVLTSTDGKQVPWDNSSLVGDVYLAAPPPAVVATANAMPASIAAPDTGTAELLFWQSVAKADTKAMYEGYLHRYGENGQFAFIAHQRIQGSSENIATAPTTAASSPEAGQPLRGDTCQQLVTRDPDLVDVKAALPACEAELRQHPGDANALNGLGRAQTAAKNYIEANRLLDAAIKAGNTQAYSVLGEAYYLGHGTLQNYARAYDLFKQGVDKGDTVAMIDLGAMYGNGYFVKKDPLKAQQLYAKAIELGNYSALRNLGVLYYNGDGVSRNYRLALDYFNQAASHGDAASMKVLADIYERGLAGMRRDPEKAREWNVKAGRVRP